MAGAVWLNVGSVIFGLLAWLLPIVSLVLRTIADHRNWGAFSAASVGACAVSLCMQLFYTAHLVKLEDWSALMDTSQAVALAAVLLLIVTVILNTITFAVYHRKAENR